MADAPCARPSTITSSASRSSHASYASYPSRSPSASYSSRYSGPSRPACCWCFATGGSAASPPWLLGIRRLPLEAGEMSVWRMSRESGISRRCLTEWKNRKGELEGAYGARCRLHGRGRSSWYRDMEAEVYRRFLAHRKKSSRPVSCYLVVLLFVCSRLFTALTLCLCLLFLPSRVPDCETDVKNFWTYVRHSRRQYKIDLPWILNVDQTPLWLEMPSERTVEEVGSRSVPVRSGGYQKERVTVMLACTASGEKLKP
ncbi:unnamed protein product [Closterium sp. NIES-53]